MYTQQQTLIVTPLLSLSLSLPLCTNHAATRPVPFDIDNAYWSETPKLITVNKDRPSLGITLVTREVSGSSWTQSIIVTVFKGSVCVCVCVCVCVHECLFVWVCV